MPNQHKHAPIRFRPPEANRAWLMDYAERTGQPINAVLAKALETFRASVERGEGEKSESVTN